MDEGRNVAQCLDLGEGDAPVFMLATTRWHRLYTQMALRAKSVGLTPPALPSFCNTLSSLASSCTAPPHA